MCAVLRIVVFLNSLTSSFSTTFYRHFLDDFDVVPVAPVITGITFVITFHIALLLFLDFCVLK